MTLEIINEDNDIEVIEIKLDVDMGTIELVNENQSTNIEFCHTQDTPLKVKQLKRKPKVHTCLIFQN